MNPSRLKRTNDELKAARPTKSELLELVRIPVSILVENVRSVHNVGSIFRSADGFGAEKIYLTGYTAYPPRDDLHKVALGAEESTPWEQFEDPLVAAEMIKSRGIQLVGIEQTISSQSIYEMQWEFPTCFVVGNEVTGVTEELLKLCHTTVEIPMFGIKQSLNVSVATGVVGYEIARAFKEAGGINYR
ncbi:MAG: RNA methyltransferase [Candidatus Marinimicrobia bacterium]|nr:RNA methyltransferase [Candidatus Neomarinimicrobiota bacterium]